MPKRTGRPVVLCLTACISLTGSCKGITSDGCLIGPCFRGPVKQVPRVAFVVGLPDSLVSTDPANQIGLLRVSDSLTLRHVMPRSPNSPAAAPMRCSAPAGMDFSSCPGRARRSCSPPTGTSRSDRSRRRWCSRILRWRSPAPRDAAGVVAIAFRHGTLGRAPAGRRSSSLTI